MFKESSWGWGEKENTKQSFVREFKTNQKELKHCGSIACWVFFFSFLSLSVSWGAWVSERWYFCHKLWEEVNVRPPPAQVLCPNHPVTGKLFGKTGLVRQRVVGEHGVVPWGAGAVGVLTGGRVLLEGHRQVQVLLSEERSEVRLWCHSQTFSLFGGQMIGKKFSVLFQVFRIWNTLEMLCCFTLFTRMQL